MIDLRTTTVRLVVSVTLGACIIGGLFVPDALANNEDSRSGWIGPAVLLLSPYIVLSIAGARTFAVVWLLGLALLAISTVLGLAAAASTSTGALIFLWLLPAQWLLSLSAVFLRD